MKKIEEYEILNHGVENSQYFQGCGTAYTEFTDKATGIGNTYSEALDDALESLAQNDWDVSTIDEQEEKPAKEETCEDVLGEESAEDTYWYVSVRVK